MVVVPALLFYGLIPVAGAFLERREWRLFRRRFTELRKKPVLDYASLASPSGVYRFWGAFESVTEDGTIWIRGDELTVQADIRSAQIFKFPGAAAGETPAVFNPAEETPEKINRNRISGIAREAKVFVGGCLVEKEKRRVFASVPETPLVIIFYEGSEKALSVRALRAGRHRNEFNNFLTPYSFIVGVFSEIIVALMFLSRPAYWPLMASALAAVFVPILPRIPPGILFTVVYRRLWFEARVCRAYRDLARYPLAYVSGKQVPAAGRLANGENFVIERVDTLPDTGHSGGTMPPFFIGGREKKASEAWYVFGARPENGNRNEAPFPREPEDAFAVAGILPGECENLAKRYTKKAYVLEILAWLFLLAGIGVNLFFIRLVLLMIQQ